MWVCLVHGLGGMKRDETGSSYFLRRLIESRLSVLRMSVMEFGISSSKKIMDELIPHCSHHWWWLMRMWSHQLSFQSNMRLDEFIPHFHPLNQIRGWINSSLTSRITLSHPSLTLNQTHQFSPLVRLAAWHGHNPGNHLEWLLGVAVGSKAGSSGWRYRSPQRR
jgi:hypothetical protein